MHVKKMIATHPDVRGSVNDALIRAIEACYDCAHACTSCADACLAEEMVQQLRQCIRLNLDCADVCHVTGLLMTRPSHRDAPALRAQLQACIDICRACGEECERHGRMGMEHCEVCAEACRACVEACEQMMGALVP